MYSPWGRKTVTDNWASRTTTTTISGQYILKGKMTNWSLWGKMWPDIKETLNLVICRKLWRTHNLHPPKKFPYQFAISFSKFTKILKDFFLWLYLWVYVHVHTHTHTHTHMFPRCLSDKESTCQCRRHKLDSWVGKTPWRRKWQLAPAFLPGKYHGQRILVDCSPWGCKELDTA